MQKLSKSVKDMFKGAAWTATGKTKTMAKIKIAVRDLVIPNEISDNHVLILIIFIQLN